MERMSLRARIGAAVTGLAVAAAVGATLAPSASAVLVGAIESASAAPTVYTGITNQAAGDWTSTVLPAMNTGDQLKIQIDDSDGAPTLSDNCVAAGDAVGFTSSPTVTNTIVGNTGAFTVLLSKSAACVAPGVNDILRIQATNRCPRVPS